MKRIWMDVEDLFAFAQAGARLTGIQRVVLEICAAFMADPHMADHVGFVRHNVQGTGFVVVSWAQVQAVWQALSGQDTEQPEKMRIRSLSVSHSTNQSLLQKCGQHVPVSVRVPAGKLIRNSQSALQAGSALVRGLWGLASQTLRKKDNLNVQGQAFSPQKGDILLSLGASWSHAMYQKLLRQCRQQYGMRIGVLVHDLVPLLWPEWCQPGLPAVFRRWYQQVVPECDVIFANSESTQKDVLTYAQQSGKPLSVPVIVVPMGCGFSKADPESASASVQEHIKQLGPYVLCAGTLEVRKNHALLVRVWRRLLQERPANAVPKLVIAGGQGWLVDDLLQQLENSAWLNGHVVWIDRPSDSCMAQLYKQAQFTIFPSFYEGWGLPVTESLYWGKPSLTASASSLPEAGMGLTEMFDPDNASQALELVRNVLDQPQGLAAMEQQIKAHFQPTSWSQAAQTLWQTVM
ncbi:glycosyltransferase family 4 protein [Acetobacter pasteurianus]|uniref:glycosyltransferase family 4 protein n=1 Tax=Acetobacter pasteurianus TaxID=438 RepID=UPI0013647A7C|nr:glycosyltransferase family 1 protein [Acetobacter pasteurianus]QHM92237.1 glycosyltransferase family 1 protein [Acetobacter pasteurianus]